MGLKTLRKELPEVSLPVLMQQARHRKIILPGKRYPVDSVCSRLFNLSNT
ncbi:MAG: hypothetical protein M0C28_40690 [Candidatus Moduliflexus flocculans]|nr:hypothetical protein [Candidatus Moduliflexus flocculans]